MKGSADGGNERVAATAYEVAVDTGGTFTDIAVRDAAGTLTIWKVPSNPLRPDEAVVDGSVDAVRRAGGRAVDIARFVHGTTVATNTLLTGEGARTALVTTTGFRDLLIIGRQTRPDLYDFEARRPRPLVPRSLTFEVDTRIDAYGGVVAKATDDQLSQLITELEAASPEVIVVSLINGYQNPALERELADLLRDLTSVRSVQAATDITSEMREFERTSTAVANGYVQPRIADHVERIEAGLQRRSIEAPLWIMQSNGGLLSAESSSRLSVRTILSGPAGGAAAAASLATRYRLPYALAIDIGGTSTDISLIREGTPDMVTEGEVGGYVIRLPMIDIHTIGAGGGSVACVDSAGSLRVGPESAGANPGPACYGKGGASLTVTDAHLLLGRLGETLLGGRLRLDRTLAEVAANRVAAAAELRSEDVPPGMLKIVTAAMARGIRKVSVERGIDTRECSLIAFGGAGPLHAADLMRELGIKTALIPEHAGIGSALGLLASDVIHDFAQSLRVNADEQGLAEATAIGAQLTERARAVLLDSERLTPDAVRIERALDMRYRGQSYELTIRWESEDAAHDLRLRFEDEHERRYGFRAADPMVETMAVRVRGVGVSTSASRVQRRSRTADIAPPTSTRAVHFGGEHLSTPVYAGSSLQVDRSYEGPAIVEQFDTTVVVALGQRFHVDDFATLWLVEGS